MGCWIVPLLNSTRALIHCQGNSLSSHTEKSKYNNYSSILHKSIHHYYWYHQFMFSCSSSPCQYCSFTCNFKQSGINSTLQTFQRGLPSHMDGWKVRLLLECAGEYLDGKRVKFIPCWKITDDDCHAQWKLPHIHASTHYSPCIHYLHYCKRISSGEWTLKSQLFFFLLLLIPPLQCDIAFDKRKEKYILTRHVISAHADNFRV